MVFQYIFPFYVNIQKFLENKNWKGLSPSLRNSFWKAETGNILTSQAVPVSGEKISLLTIENALYVIPFEVLLSQGVLIIKTKKKTQKGKYEWMGAGIRAAIFSRYLKQNATKYE